MEELTWLAILESNLNILKVIKILYILGKLIKEYHVVLKPFIDITLTRVPYSTQ